MDITTGWITVNGRCNNRCSWCYRAFETGNGPDLSFDKVAQVIDLFASLDVISIVLIGGEPTLYKDLPMTIKHAKQTGTPEVTVVTNGRALADVSRIQELATSGVDILSITIHSIDPAIHDAITGVQSWNETFAGIRNALQLGIRCNINLVAGNENYQSVAKTAEQLVTMGVETVVVTCAMPYYESTEGVFHQEHSLEPNIFAELIEGLKETPLEVQIMHELPLCLIQPETLRQLLEAGKLGYGCHVGTGNGVCVNNNGHLAPCNTMGFLDLGDLFHQGTLAYSKSEFLEMWERTQSELRENVNVFRSPYCSTCPVWSSCKAGCPVVWGTREPAEYIRGFSTSFAEELQKLNGREERGGVL